MSSDAAGDLPTGRLTLEPLEVEHADEMVSVLSNPALYDFTGGEPPTGDALVSRYRAQVAGSGRQGEQWHNWIMRRTDTDEVIGFVQATVVDGVADIAWLVGVEHQRQGFAVEAVLAMIAELENRSVRRFAAHIHSDHRESQRVAAAVGLEFTGALDNDGEEIWLSSTNLQ